LRGLSNKDSKSATTGREEYEIFLKETAKKVRRIL
jgi:hypothetical protein